MIEFNKPKKTDALKTLWKEAFGDSDEFINLFFSTAYSELRCNTAYIENQLVGALYWFECRLGDKKIAYIYAISTAEKHRGKGVCRKLLQNTHEKLTSMGFSATVLVPGTPGLFEFYEHLGYKTCCYINEFEVLADETKTELTQICAEEYMQLRKKFLTVNSVIQEKENTEFLKHLVHFYKGEDCILAANIQNNKLICYELLGNYSQASKVVTAFGCKKGTFRTIGTNKPFAMCYSFGSTSLPSIIHFSFAFD